MKTLIVLAAFAALSATPALAWNGKAITGLPFDADEPGYYYVTCNLTGTSGEHGITVRADDVVIDLRGFVLEGLSDSEAGIITNGSDRTRVVNGTILNWPNGGALLQDGATVTEVNVRGCGDMGIGVGPFSLVDRCVLQRNSGGDLRAGRESIVEDCRIQSLVTMDLVSVELGKYTTATRVVVRGGWTAFDAAPYARLEECSASEFEYAGFELDVGATASRCVADGATPMPAATYGILAGDNTRITDCSVATVVIGIQTGSRSLVTSSIVSDVGSGIHTEDYSRISGCNVSQSTGNGVTLGRGAYLGHTTMTDCALFGVNGGRRSVIADCQAHENGTGFNVAGYSVLVRNYASQNVASGFSTPLDGSSFQENHATMNANGFLISGKKNIVIRNRAILNTTQDFQVPYGNPFAPTLNSGWAIQGSYPQANFRTPF